MFKGQFLHIIDSKKRIAIPAKLRKYFSPDANNSLVMTQGIEKCIEIYPKDQWVTIEEKLLKLNTFKSKDTRFIRMMLQNVKEDELDSQSRIIIPQNLLDYADIKTDVLILGVLKRIEIWNPNIYKEYIESSPHTLEQIAEEVMNL